MIAHTNLLYGSAPLADRRIWGTLWHRAIRENGEHVGKAQGQGHHQPQRPPRHPLHRRRLQTPKMCLSLAEMWSLSQQGCFKEYIMSAAQGRNSVGENWLVDCSDLLEGGCTRVIFYNPRDENEYEDIVFDLEGFTIERITRIEGKNLEEVTYGYVKCKYVPKAQKKKLKTYLKMLFGGKQDF